MSISLPICNVDLDPGPGPGFEILIASALHLEFAGIICDEMEQSALLRGIGISKRNPEYIQQLMLEGKGIIAFDMQGNWAGFSYIESWEEGKFVSNSGLIVSPVFRKSGVARMIKNAIFELSRKLFPGAKIFGLTSSLAVMKINSDLGYRPVTYSQLPQSEGFWSGCKSCVNFKTLTD